MKNISIFRLLVFILFTGALSALLYKDAGILGVVICIFMSILGARPIHGSKEWLWHKREYEK